MGSTFQVTCGCTLWDVLNGRIPQTPPPPPEEWFGLYIPECVGVTIYQQLKYCEIQLELSGYKYSKLVFNFNVLYTSPSS